jgi:hypothetical protein
MNHSILLVCRTGNKYEKKQGKLIEYAGLSYKTWTEQVGLQVTTYTCIWKVLVRISAKTSAILAKVFRAFPHSLEKCRDGTSIRPGPLRSKSFPIYHYSCIGLSSDAIQFQC